MDQPLLRVEAISKQFPGVRALDQVSLEIRAGEVHALVGENGAGKSTLISVLAGSVPPDSGRIILRGREIAIQSPIHASRLGIRVVFQHLSLVPTLTVAENLFLGRELSAGGILSRRQMAEAAASALAGLGEQIDPHARVRDLPVAQRYLVEIAKATLGDFSILAFDEPTASLTVRETERLFALVRRLVAQGKGIIWVTHRLEELAQIADRITVLRDGRYVTTVPAGSVSQGDLIRHMTGKEHQEVFPPPPAVAAADAPPAVAVRGLCTRSGLRDITFSLQPGEVLGVGGLIGSGKTELGRALYGLEAITAGEVSIFGRPVKPERLRPTALARAGVMYFPADRRAEGLVLCRPVGENMTLAALARFERSGLLHKRREQASVQAMISRLAVNPPRAEQRVSLLSGGNQQKVMLGRGLISDTRLFIVDEPTQGIDVGAKIGIYRLIHALAESGAAVLMISSDLLELVHLCHRVLVMYRGQASAMVPHAAATEERLLRHYFGEIKEDGNELAG